MTLLKVLYLLDPEVIYLNHGAFGATPRPVFEAYQEWQRRLERQPVEFLDRQAPRLLAEARARLGEYIGCQPDDVVYFTNPTTAVNMIARSLDLHPGDEILATDHEYGAMDRVWSYISQKTGAKYIRWKVPLPLSDPHEWLEDFWAGVSHRTRAIFISHITSPTALRFPVEALCRRARQAGLLTIVDGAHAPGHIPINLASLQADMYTGACHKWLSAPKGAAFLYVCREAQAWLEPLVVSWGYDPDTPAATRFIDTHEMQGTRDLAAMLSVPAAIDFQEQHQWEAVRQRCHALVQETRVRLHARTGLAPICPADERWLGQMAAIPLPDLQEVDLQSRIYNEYRIEVPVYRWNGQVFLRVSFQAYNTRADADALVDALDALLPDSP